MRAKAPLARCCFWTGRRHMAAGAAVWRSVVTEPRWRRTGPRRRRIQRRVDEDHQRRYLTDRIGCIDVPFSSSIVIAQKCEKLRRIDRLDKKMLNARLGGSLEV